MLAWHSPPGCPIPRGCSCLTCPHAGAGTDGSTRHCHWDPAKPSWLQRDHPWGGHGVTLAWPHAWWHLHEHPSTCGGTSKATHPSVSSYPWWHLHGHLCPGLTTPMVTCPSSWHPWWHSQATCPPSLPHPSWVTGTRGEPTLYSVLSHGQGTSQPLLSCPVNGLPYKQPVRKSMELLP